MLRKRTESQPVIAIPALALLSLLTMGLFWHVLKTAPFP
jgi:hypothetical protein